MYNNKKLVMCGCLESGVPVIEFLLQKGVNFDYFVTLTEEQGTKNKVSGYYDYTEIAKQHGIPVYYPKKYNLKTSEDEIFFKENKFDLLIQGGWQRLFPENILSTLSIGAIGIHGSPDFLPKGRGRSPLNWSLIQDKKRFILSFFIMKAGVDDGDVFATSMFDILPYDDIKTLYYKIGITVKKILGEHLSDILSGNISLFPQNGLPSYFEKRTEEDGKIDWETMDVYEIYNLVRATTRPYPGAFGIIDGKIMKIWKARVFDTRITYPKSQYGSVVENFHSAFVVNCLGGLLLVEDWEVIEK